MVGEALEEIYRIHPQSIRIGPVFKCVFRVRFVCMLLLLLPLDLVLQKTMSQEEMVTTVALLTSANLCFA